MKKLVYCFTHQCFSVGLFSSHVTMKILCWMKERKEKLLSSFIEKEDIKVISFEQFPGTRLNYECEKDNEFFLGQ